MPTNIFTDKHNPKPAEPDGVAHYLKCWPEPFEAMLRGDKTAEFRYNDRDYGVGDRLRIQEWCPQSEAYTGREIERIVSHVLSAGYGIPEGYAMLSLANLAPEPVDAFVEVLQRDAFVTCESEADRYSLRFTYPTLARAQEAHTAWISRNLTTKDKPHG